MEDCTPMRELSFGEKAMGIEFNPSNSGEVAEIKEQCAKLANFLNEKKEKSENGEVKRMLSVAITELQTAQMRGVKAVTWKY